MRKVILVVFFIVGLGMTIAHADKIKAIATFSVLGDVVNNVAGNSIDLTVLVGPDRDTHEYEPTPADSVNISHANIIFENGLYFETWLDKLYSASGSKARRIVSTQGVIPSKMEENSQEIEPHAWQDVTNV